MARGMNRTDISRIATKLKKRILSAEEDSSRRIACSPMSSSPSYTAVCGVSHNFHSVLRRMGDRLWTASKAGTTEAFRIDNRNGLWYNSPIKTRSNP